jgi:hypothetical protein
LTTGQRQIPEALERLLQRVDIWRGEGSHSLQRRVLPSGFVALDTVLPGGGWPLGALTEIFAPSPAAGGLGLTIPALAELTREGRWLAWIDPPHLPYAPALIGMGIDLSRTALVRSPGPQESLWALEQALRSGACGGVLGWLEAGDPRWLRRLQLAAESGDAWCVLFRPPGVAGRSSPAALRLAVKADGDHLIVNVLKCRGSRPGRPVRVPRLQ